MNSNCFELSDTFSQSCFELQMTSDHLGTMKLQKFRNNSKINLIQNFKISLK